MLYNIYNKLHLTPKCKEHYRDPKLILELLGATIAIIITIIMCFWQSTTNHVVKQAEFYIQENKNT